MPATARHYLTVMVWLALLGLAVLMSGTILDQIKKAAAHS